MADYEHEWAMIGTLVNGTYLKNPQKIEIDWVGEYHCLQTIRVPSELPNSVDNGHKDEVIRLPIKVVEMFGQQKIMYKLCISTEWPKLEVSLLSNYFLHWHTN